MSTETRSTPSWMSWTTRPPRSLAMRRPARPTSITSRLRYALSRSTLARPFSRFPSGPGLDSKPELRAFLCSRFEEAAGFERLVIDYARPLESPPAGWNLSNAILKCSAHLLSQDVTLPPARVLRHGFYLMQSVTGGAGGGLGPWGSGLDVVASGSLRGEAPRTPRLVVIVGPGSVDVYSMLRALQGQGLAEIMREGDEANAGLMVKFEVEEGPSISVRHGEWLYPDGSAGFQPDLVVPLHSVSLRQ